MVCAPRSTVRGIQLRNVRGLLRPCSHCAERRQTVGQLALHSRELPNSREFRHVRQTLAVEVRLHRMLIHMLQQVLGDVAQFLVAGRCGPAEDLKCSDL